MKNIVFHILLGPPSSGKSFGLSSYLNQVSLFGKAQSLNIDKDIIMKLYDPIPRGREFNGFYLQEGLWNAISSLLRGMVNDESIKLLKNEDYETLVISYQGLTLDAIKDDFFVLMDALVMLDSKLQEEITFQITLGLYTTEDPYINYELMQLRTEAGGIGAHGLTYDQISNIWRDSNASFVKTLEFLRSSNSLRRLQMNYELDYFVRIVDKDMYESIRNSEARNTLYYNSSQIKFYSDGSIQLNSEEAKFILKVS